MRLENLPEVLIEAERLISAIEAKSWHHSVNAAHKCLCVMPSPAWMEDAPGLAKYYGNEPEANRWLNRLRRNIMGCLISLLSEDRSWEATDDWPPPVNLKWAVGELRVFCEAVHDDASA